MFGNFDRSRVGRYNWSRTNHLAMFSQVQEPESINEIKEILMRPNVKKIRMIGSGLSYEPMNRVEESGILMSLSKLKGRVPNTNMDPNTATFYAGTSLQDVFDLLTQEGKMLPSCPGVIGIQTIAGAIATGTHGQGMGEGVRATLSDSIISMKLILADGTDKVVHQKDKHFGAYLMAYGSLGIVTQVTFETVPMDILTCIKITTTFEYLLRNFAHMNKNSKYVKAWWFPNDDKCLIWNVNKADEKEILRFENNDCKLIEISEETNDNLNSTIDEMMQQMSFETRDETLEGEHFETVKRFKDVKNAVGNIYQIFCKGIPAAQINCEIAVPFKDMNKALKKLQEWYKTTEQKPHYPFILRCTNGSKAYLSGAYEREVCWIGFLVYLAEDGSFAGGSLKMMEELQILLAEFNGVPHFGKHFIKDIFKEQLEKNLKLQEFKDLRIQLDPTGVFENQFLSDFFN